MGAIRAMPVPTYADGGTVPGTDAQAAYDGVAWEAAHDNGSMWSGWRGLNHRVAEFERAPAALAFAVTRSFMRAHEAERSSEGFTCENAYGGRLQIRIARDEAALIASDLNLALLREISKIEMVSKLRDRGGFKLVAATDGAYTLNGVAVKAGDIILVPADICAMVFSARACKSLRRLPPLSNTLLVLIRMR
jgi:hypothetical protein